MTNSFTVRLGSTELTYKQRNADTYVCEDWPEIQLLNFAGAFMLYEACDGPTIFPGDRRIVSDTPQGVIDQYVRGVNDLLMLVENRAEDIRTKKLMALRPKTVTVVAGANTFTFHARPVRYEGVTSYVVYDCDDNIDFTLEAVVEEGSDDVGWVATYYAVLNTQLSFPDPQAAVNRLLADMQGYKDKVQAYSHYIDIARADKVEAAYKKLTSPKGDTTHE